MTKRTVSIVILAFLLSSLFAFSVSVRPVRAVGTIYIRADGSIDPPSAPIQQSGSTYTLTGDVYDEIVVQKSSILIDGQGHTVLGDGTANGIELSGLTTVTLYNMTVSTCDYGINVSLSDHIIIYRMTLINNNDGITLTGSSYSVIYANTITSNAFEGIYLYYSYSNTIAGNVITSNQFDGIYLYSSSNNAISANQITANEFDGIYLYYSTSNTITENNVTKNENGVSAYYSTGNKFFHNTFANNLTEVNPQSPFDIWDNGYPAGGNKWSDYGGIDSNLDGIGDTPYVIDANNQDNYPLMNSWAHKVGDVNYDGKVDIKDVFVVSKSYGTSMKGPNPSGRFYSPIYDLYSDAKIDMRDLYIVIQRYGT